MEDKELVIEDIITRAVSEFIDPDGVFIEKLRKKIRGEYPQDIIIKFGADPTRPDIHIGHAVVLRKLRQLQELGCKVVFLIGDFTAQIGDPTGKSKVRPEIDQKEVEKNMKTYLDQVGNILLTDEKHFSWVRNSHWFTGVADIVIPPDVKLEIGMKTKDGESKAKVAPNSFVGKALFYEKNNMQLTHLKRKEVSSVTLRGLLWTLRHITHSRLIARDMFQERIKSGGELYMHEMMYPVLQGIDSNILHTLYGSCDMEIGGTDQTFNMLIGRDVMKVNKQDQQSVMCIDLLEGLDGSEKMSKSLDNYVGITDTPHDMYGKIMSIPDKNIIRYFKLCTYTPSVGVVEIETNLEKGELDQRSAKMRLAHEIVSIYHGEEAAKASEDNFVNVFSNKSIPESIPEITQGVEESLVDMLLREGYVSSKSDFRRLIEGGGIRLCKDEQEKITDIGYIPNTGEIIKVGKKTFLKITS